ncbi:MAG: UvrD-helicase domain-containing protein [Clostridiales bacterium]|nr:UvrD-helicase domain-containing protein [Clostridiales bacterium]
MGVNWTPEQKQAIETHTGSLLVSAAAGSGKTAVLVERIMQRILDDGDPRDIDEFLIVTYTNAAASEMRYKIAQAIENRLSENPGDRRLLRQLRLLNGAQVMTVHSFCLGFLREHFHLAGLAPDFRVADQSELEMLKESAIKTVLERAYDEMDQNPNFPKLVESFSGMRDDRAVEEVILGTFEKLQSHSFPDQWMEQVKKNFEPSERARIEDSEWGSYLLERAKNAIESGKRYLFSALDTINRFPVLQEKYGPSFDSDLTQFDSLLELIKKGSWDDAAAYAQDITFLKLGSVRKFEDEEALAQIKSSRDTAKKIIAAVQEKYLPKRSEEVGRELATVSLVVTELFRLVNKFDTEFSKAKRKRNLVDFSDLEHFTVSILCEEYHFETKTAKPSDAATSVASQFAEILVDEYQDTNEVQDLIFNLVSKSSKNLFMVGDVKQSIYRFRLADPSIFLQKYNAWPDVSDEADKNGARVILSKNFRSRKSVLDAVNFLFCALLKGGFGELIYSDKEKH